jgi:hypothetical protein
VLTGLAVLALAQPLAERFGARVPLAAAAIASAGLIVATTAPVAHPGALLRLAEELLSRAARHAPSR